MSPVTRWGLGLLAMLGVFSSALAPRPLYAFAEVGLLFALLGVAVTLAGSWCEQKGGRAVVEWVVLSCAVSLSLAVLIRHGVDLASGGAGWPVDVIGAFTNPRLLNHTQVLILPILWGVAARLRTSRSGSTAVWAVRLIAASHISLIIASGARAASLSLVVGLVAAGLVLGQNRRAFLVEAMWAVGLGALGFVGLFGVGGGGVALHRGGTSGRAELWAGAIRMIVDRPWLGIGPMHFSLFDVPDSGVVSPHNVLLQVAAEWGLPAAVLAVGLVARGAWAWTRTLRLAPSGDVWPAALSAAAVAGLVDSLFAGTIGTPVVQVLWVFLLAALLSEDWALRSPVSPISAQASGRRGLPLVLVLALAPCAGVVAQDLEGLGERVTVRNARLDPSLAAGARFWQIGTIAPPEGPPADRQDRYWP